MVRYNDSKIYQKFSKSTNQYHNLANYDIYPNCLIWCFLSFHQNIVNLCIEGIESEEEKRNLLNSNTQKVYTETIEWLDIGINKILEECKDNVSSLEGYTKKLFLLMTSLFIVAIKFPHKYGFLSLDPDTDKSLSKYQVKVTNVELKLKECVLNIQFEGIIIIRTFTQFHV